MVGLDGIGISQFEIYFNDSDFEIPGLDIIADIESLVILKRNRKKKAMFQSFVIFNLKSAVFKPFVILLLAGQLAPDPPHRRHRRRVRGEHPRQPPRTAHRHHQRQPRRLFLNCPLQLPSDFSEACHRLSSYVKKKKSELISPCWLRAVK